MDHTKFHYGRDGFRENSAAIFFVIVGYDTILSYIYIYIYLGSRLSVSFEKSHEDIGDRGSDLRRGRWPEFGRLSAERQHLLRAEKPVQKGEGVFRQGQLGAVHRCQLGEERAQPGEKLEEWEGVDVRAGNRLGQQCHGQADRSRELRQRGGWGIVDRSQPQGK